jgi:hypothetical protein
MKKICTKCKDEKELEDFYKNSKKKDGYNVMCKPCMVQYNKEHDSPETRKKWMENNKEYNKKIHKEYYDKNKTQMNKQSSEFLQTPPGKFLSYRNGAKRRKIEFELTKDEFNSFWQKNCYYCDSTINTIGIDRVDSNIGYYLNNCVPCCYKCNQIKMNMKPIEFLEQIKRIYINLRLWEHTEKLMGI